MMSDSDFCVIETLQRMNGKLQEELKCAEIELEQIRKAYKKIQADLEDNAEKLIDDLERQIVAQDKTIMVLNNRLNAAEAYRKWKIDAVL